MASAGIRKTPTGRYKVWWRLDDGSQGSQTFDGRDPDRSPATLQATEGRLRRYLLPFFGQRQLRAITVSMVRRWQNELRGQVGFDTVMACRSVLNRVLQAAEDDRRIAANPVPKAPAPKPPADPAVLLGRAKRRSHTPEELGRLLAAARPWCRDHFLTMAGTGMR